MGERYTIIAFGAQNVEPPNGEDTYWGDWLHDLERKGAYPDLVKGCLRINEEAYEFASSYEAEPAWIGFEVWYGSEDNLSEPLNEALERQAGAKVAWERLRFIVRSELGVELPEGRLLIATDHT